MEVVKRHWECENDNNNNNNRETSGEEEHNSSSNNDDDSLHKVAFAVGTFILMVCLKRFLVEQWRAWIFLLLNVILLSIFFISTKTPRSDQGQDQSQSQTQRVKTHSKKGGELLDSSSNSPSSGESKECSANNNVKEEDEEEEEEEVATLSKAELNERVEAFIAMFRQHLISDVKQGFSFPQNTANLTQQTNKIQVSCC